MYNGRNVIYLYDGTFDGLMCCVFESYTQKEIPDNIVCEMPEQLCFCDIRSIENNRNNAERVIASIPKKSSIEALELIKTAFLTCAEDKEMLILKMIYKLYRYGAKALDMLADETVDKLTKAVFHCTHEAHLLKGFIRFNDYYGVLSAVITPKNTVLPLIAGHFTDRYRNESFLIFDKTHSMALIYKNYKAEIIYAADYTPPEQCGEEFLWESLWKTFYDTIAIKERYNPKCRMSLMPKRYWQNMTEMSRFLNQGNDRKFICEK